MSQDLEPLEGIVDSKYDEYQPTYGINMQARELVFTAEGVLESMPLNHLDAGLGLEDCVTCHSVTDAA